MPASYAHYKFGKLLLPQMPSETRSRIQRFRRLYDLGLQGPDFFFYYNPLIKTATGSLGGQYHKQSGQIFFAHAASAATTEAAQAYLYGLLGHYVLDAMCHPYVNRVVEAGEARHVALESEFDRFLMEQDGKPTPHTYSIAAHLKPTKGECVTVADFYPPATGAQVFQSVRLMAFCLKFLAGGNRTRREKLLRRLNPNLPDSMIPVKPVEGFRRMDQELLDRFEKAVHLYPVMLEQLRTHMQTGEALGEDFAPNFETGIL